MMTKVKSKIVVSIYCLYALFQLSSCSIVGNEGECRIEYINYRFINNDGTDGIEKIFKMTDFIFTKDSVLYRVDDGIMNGQMRQRPLNLPDGEWIIVTYGNLNGNSQIDYTTGETKLSQMTVRLKSKPAYAGVYNFSKGISPVGDADQLYYGRLNLSVKDGYTDKIHTVSMSNAHIWLSGIITWKNRSAAPARSENLNLRLECVPVEHSFLTDELYDNYWQMSYSVPRITDETATYMTKLQPGLSADEFTFSMHGMRWVTGKAPVLKIYDGETPLIDQDLPLNTYFQEEGTDLTHTRIQSFHLSIEINGSNISISNLMIDDWEDGGNIGAGSDDWN